MNSIGKIYSLTTFGESHGVAIGGIIDGVPAGIRLDMEAIQQYVNRRRPGQSAITTTRQEDDKIEFLSGIFEGATLGTPIGFIIRNKEQRSEHYDNLRNIYRPSHADYTYMAKYGHRDHRGGGRASARDTASWCVAGAIAAQILQQQGVEIAAYTSQIGAIATLCDYASYDLSAVYNNPVRCPDNALADSMEELIKSLKEQGDSIGGTVTCVARGVPAGWGEPLFDKLQADLAKAMLSINAAKGFEYGMGFAGAAMRGSQVCDNFVNREGNITTSTNFSGGIQGGISNGNDIYFRVAFKPTPTLLRAVDTVTTDGTPVTTTVSGRHDPCVVPRAVPVVEALTAITLCDHYLRNKTSKL